MEISPFLSELEAIDSCVTTTSIPPSMDSHLGPNPEGEQEPGPPHEALLLVLAYLPVFELLAMREVCSSFRAAVNNDVLLWLDIIVEKPLSSWLSNESLMKTASKAEGRLRTLTLINCVKITDDGLQRVVDQNPFISKLHVPACIGLSPEGIIRAAKTLSQNHNRLKSLQINGIYNINKEHLETLSSCLQMNPEQKRPRSLLYCHHGSTRPSRNKDTDALIDVEICPKCKEVRMVFDCPREACTRKRDLSPADCRGCRFCIPRCEECGQCVDSGELEEAACAGILCLSCWLHLPKCNFCNKPYCTQHANQHCSSLGFVCDVCGARASSELDDNIE